MKRYVEGWAWKRQRGCQTWSHFAFFWAKCWSFSAIIVVFFLLIFAGVSSTPQKNPFRSTLSTLLWNFKGKHISCCFSGAFFPPEGLPHGHKTLFSEFLYFQCLGSSAGCTGLLLYNWIWIVGQHLTFSCWLSWDLYRLFRQRWQPCAASWTPLLLGHFQRIFQCLFFFLRCKVNRHSFFWVFGWQRPLAFFQRDRPIHLFETIFYWM